MYQKSSVGGDMDFWFVPWSSWSLTTHPIFGTFVKILKIIRVKSPVELKLRELPHALHFWYDKRLLYQKSGEWVVCRRSFNSTYQAPKRFDSKRLHLSRNLQRRSEIATQFLNFESAKKKRHEKRPVV